jgi:ferritin-like protein
MSERLPTVRLTRRRLLQLAAGAGGGALSAAFLAGVRAVEAAPTDVQLLNRLVVLEDQAVYLYGQLVSRLMLPSATPAAGAPVDPITVIQTAGVTVHTGHRDSLVQALRRAGGVPVTVDAAYPQLVPAAKDQPTTLAAMTTMETTLLGAYQGAQGAFSSAQLGGNVASIPPVTARTLALLLAAQGKPPVPESFVVGDPTAAALVTVTAGSVGSSSSSSSSSTGSSSSSTSSGAASSSSSSST